jgi:hypothetical protein
MRLDGTWKDVCIRNISSRGMLIQASVTPPRGAYVEVRRGRHAIVARIAWSNEQRFGVQTQDRLNVEAVLKEPDLSGNDHASKLQTQPSFERRAAPRPSQADLRWKAERSRYFSRSLEFACVGAVAASGGFLMFDTVSGILSRSVAVVTAELAK